MFIVGLTPKPFQEYFCFNAAYVSLEASPDMLESHVMPLVESDGRIEPSKCCSICSSQVLVLKAVSLDL